MPPLWPHFSACWRHGITLDRIFCQVVARGVFGQGVAGHIPKLCRSFSRLVATGKFNRMTRDGKCPALLISSTFFKKYLVNNRERLCSYVDTIVFCGSMPSVEPPCSTTIERHSPAWKRAFFPIRNNVLVIDIPSLLGASFGGL
jgi:hypothetical protein